MPYIHPDRRAKLDKFAALPPQTPGELNYRITKQITQYLASQDLDQALSYDVINDVLGALEGAKLEFYRRIATPYEERKLAQNGDVY